jgi:hypothetical protein
MSAGAVSITISIRMPVAVGSIGFKRFFPVMLNLL